MRWNLVLASVVVAAGVIIRAQDDSPAERFHALLVQEEAFRQSASPEWATVRGDHRFDSHWTDYSPAGLKNRRTQTRAILDRLREIDQRALAEQDALSHEILRREYELDVGEARFPAELPRIRRPGVDTRAVVHLWWCSFDAGERRDDVACPRSWRIHVLPSGSVKSAKLA
jgi:uncharacterized protein (DUF885 family)